MATIYIWPPAGTGGGAASDVNIFDSVGSSITLGQKAMAASLPVVIASNQSAIPVTSGGPTNYGVPDASTPREASMVGVGAAAVSVSNPMPSRLSDGAAFYNAPTTAQIPATLGQKAMAASLAVTVASDQSAIPVTISGTALDFGVSSAAERVAALVGNPTGAADFNFGAAGAQTLRTASILGINNAAVSVANPVFVEPGNGTNSYSSAAIAASQFTVSTATAVPESVGLALGWDGTIHREIAVDTSGHPNVVTAQLPAALGQTTMAGSTSVAIASDQSPVPVSISGGALNYGVSTAALRTAAQVGNATGVADFNYGAAGAQTLRTASMLGMGSTAVSVTNPVNVVPGNGTNNFDSTAVAAAQYTVSTATAVPESVGIMLGWDGTTHREISVTTAGIVNVNTSGTSDTDYGTPTGNTLRTASMLGMGAAAVSVSNPVNVQSGNGTNNFDSSAIAAAQFTKSTATAVPLGAGLSMGWDGVTHREISVDTSGVVNTNATLANTVSTPIFVEPGNGVASYNSAAIAAAQFTQSTAAAVPIDIGLALGWDGTTHREISVDTSGVVNTNATLSNLVTTPIFVEPGNGTNSYSSAAIAAAQFTLSTATAVPESVGLALGWDGTAHREISVSNTGVVNTATTLSYDTNFGAVGASTLRTASLVGMGSTAVSQTNPLAVQPGNGTNYYTSVAVTAAQQTFSTATLVPQSESIMMGWDGTNHREVAVTTTGSFTTSSAGLALQGSDYLDTSSTNISTTYVQLIASTSGTTSWVSIFNGSGSMLQLGVGAAASEVLYLLIPPGGVEAPLAIPSGSRVAVKQTTIGSAMTSGFFSINCLG